MLFSDFYANVTIVEQLNSMIGVLSVYILYIRKFLTKKQRLSCKHNTVKKLINIQNFSKGGYL